MHSLQTFPKRTSKANHYHKYESNKSIPSDCTSPSGTKALLTLKQIHSFDSQSNVHKNNDKSNKTHIKQLFNGLLYDYIVAVASCSRSR